jgi:hypothetical protein
LEAGGEVVGEAEMAIQRLAVELREGIDLVDAGIDAIANRNVDQPELATEGHRRLCPRERKRLQPRSRTASENDGQDTFHGLISRLRWKYN